MFVVGLTGGIASGKSTVSAMLRRHGAYVVDVDAIVRGLQQPGTRVTTRITFIWRDVARMNGDAVEIDRAKLAEIVFNDKKEKKRLEAVLFLPTVFGILSEVFYGLLWQNGIVVVDHPYLLEVRALTWLFSRIAVVSVPHEVQWDRLKARNPEFTDAHIERRIDSQMPEKERRKYADDIIDNAGGLTATEARVQELLEEWRRQRNVRRVKVCASVIGLVGVWKAVSYVRGSG